MTKGETFVVARISEACIVKRASAEQEVTLNGGQAGLYITYKNEEGYYDPNAVSLMDGNGRVVNKTDYSLIIDDPGVVCIVKKEGTYTVKAGSLVKTLQVNAGQ